jgi:class 3 adenylate cyclase
MLSPKVKWNINRILPFGIIWFVFTIVYTVLEKGILAESKLYPSTGNPYSFYSNIFITPLVAFLTGLLIGALEILYVNKKLMQMSFSKKVVYKSLLYLVLILSFLVLLSAISNYVELPDGFFSSTVWGNVWTFFIDFSFWSVVVYMTAIIVISQLYTEISENIGQGVLANFFTGKYHTPAAEERIYMFLDMKSSTTIAEQLGHVRYFEMLQEYYYDLSDPIIRHSGEIYQYVGDEVIVSWKSKAGLQNNNCLQCFFDIKESIRKQSGQYLEKYHVVPEFKAGLHVGSVTTGEIGVIKKEIMFTGDVLNATSRIQGLCNSYNVDLLVSADLLKELNLPSSWQLKSLGENELRGRNERMELFTIVMR